MKDGKKTGGQLSILYSIDKITVILSPIIGGWLAIFIGMESALYVSVGLFIFSAIPLLSPREVMGSGIKMDFKNFQQKYILKISSFRKL